MKGVEVMKNLWMIFPHCAAVEVFNRLATLDVRFVPSPWPCERVDASTVSGLIPLRSASY